MLSVERDQVRRAEGTPSDPSYPDQWALPQIGWDSVFGSVTPGGLSEIAVLDTGIDASHPDLSGLVLPGYSAFEGADAQTDPNGHGTWMAGIAAALADNGAGVSGVAYAGVSLLPVQVLGADGTGQDSDIINGIVWATDNGADVILMAFSNPGYSPALQASIDYAWDNGAILIAAAGNDGSSTATYPAGDRGVIGVSATDRNDELAAGSNYGQAIFLAAPGVDIMTTDRYGGYISISGTSASAAVVAGAAAFMRAVDTSFSNGVIVGRLACTADPAGLQEETGNGRLNLERALSDNSTDSIQPAGVPPLGEGGPYIGPYEAAANKTFTGPGNFSDATRWSGGTLPVAGDNLRINGTCTFDNAASSLAYGTLEISRGTAGSSVVWPVNGTNTLNVTSIITGSAGAGSIDMTNGGTLQIRTSWTSTNTTLTPGTGTVNWNVTGASSTLPAAITTYNNLTITATGRTASLGAATTVNGNLLISAGTLDVTTSNRALNVKGNFTNNATFTPRSGTLTLNGTADQTINGSTTPTVFRSLTINKSSGTATLGINITLSANLAVNAGTFDLSTYTANRTAAGGTLTVASGAALKIGGTNTLPSNYTTHTYGATSTIEYSGAAQMVYSENYAGNLTLSGSGAKTLQTGTTTIGGSLTLSGTATTTTVANLAITGNLNVGTGTIFTVGSNFTLGVTGTTSVTGRYNDNSTGAKTLTGDLTINTGGVWDETVVSAYSIAGNFTNNATTFTASTGTHTFSRASKTLSGGTITSIANVEISGTYTNNGTLTVGSALSGAGGLTNGTTGILNIGGTSTISTLAASSSGNTVNYTGAAQVVKAVTYHNLTLSGNGSKTLPAGATTVSGVLSMEGTASTTITGTLTYGSSATLQYQGSTAQTTGPEFPVSPSGVPNLTINNSNGVTASGNITVNGVLNLSSANPSATQGSLDMGSYTLDMGASATTTGQGDVTGIVRRTAFVAGTTYSFGNQYTAMTFAPVGSLPTSISLKISLGTAPAWKPDAIQRIYDTLQTGASGAIATLDLHYLDSELNGNTEANLDFWDYVVDPGYVAEHASSNINTVDNWVGLANLNIDYLPASFGSRLHTLANSSGSSYNTWNGSVSTAWTDSRNWTGAAAPVSTDDVVIPDAATTTYDPTLPASTTINTLTIQTGGILNGGSGTAITIADGDGAWVGTGTFNPGTSTVIFTSAEATISGTANFYNLTIDTGAVLTLGTGSTTRIAGTIINNGIWQAALLSNTVEYNGTDQTVLNPNSAIPGYSNLILSGSFTKTLAAAVTVHGDLTIGPGTTLDTSSAHSYGLTLNGNFINGGTFTAHASPITIGGTGTQSLDRFYDHRRRDCHQDRWDRYSDRHYVHGCADPEWLRRDP